MIGDERTRSSPGARSRPAKIARNRCQGGSAGSLGLGRLDGRGSGGGGAARGASWLDLSARPESAALTSSNSPSADGGATSPPMTPFFDRPAQPGTPWASLFWTRVFSKSAGPSSGVTRKIRAEPTRTSQPWRKLDETTRLPSTSRAWASGVASTL